MAETWAKSVENDSKILAAMEAGGVRNNRTNAVAALAKVGADPGVGFTLAACCAMLVSETSGWSVWGHDPWNPGMFPHGIAHPADNGDVVVTKEAYETYAKLADQPGWQPQGCGPCQLTWRADQLQADRLGGCWEPLANMTIGFGILKSDCQRGGSAFHGFWFYNGWTPQGERYAENAVAIMDRFQSLFDEAAK